MAEAINYTDQITPALLTALLQGNGGSNGQTTTTTNLNPEMLAMLQGLMGGGGGAGVGAAPQMPGIAAQITPEMLAAIFTQGAQQVPSLTGAYANASGARSSNNSGLRLALNDLNSELTRQAAVANQEQQKLSMEQQYRNAQLQRDYAQMNAQAMIAQQQMRTQLAAQLAQEGRTSTQNTNTEKTGGLKPEELLLGGFALNQFNKKDDKGKSWLDKIWGADKEVDPTATMHTAEPYNAGSEFFNLDSSFAQWEVPQMDLGAYPAMEYGNISYNVPDFGGSFGSIPDYDFGGGTYDYGGDYSGGLLGGVDTLWDFGGGSEADTFDSNYWEQFFKNGGMPMRGIQAAFADGGQPARRNIANMGTPETTYLQGTQRRQMPSQQSLIAPVRFPARPQMPKMPQQQLRPNAMLTNDPTTARREKTDGRVDASIAGSSGDLSSGPGLNATWSNDVASAVRGVAGVNGMLNQFGVGVPTGPVSGLLGATNNDQAVRASVIAGASMLSPLLGLGLSALWTKPPNSKPEVPNTPAASTSPVSTPNVPGTPLGGVGSSFDAPPSYANPTDGQMVNYPGQTGSGGSDFGGGSNWGPRGSSGDGGNTAQGPGNSDGSFADGGMVQGPGTGTSDSIPTPMANISNGEYIISADVVQRIGPAFFDGLQAMFHQGGKPA